MTVTRIGPGTYSVEVIGRAERVYIAGALGDRWLFWNGRVFRERDLADKTADRRRSASRSDGDTKEDISAPMPATVVQVLVAPGDRVEKGETLVILEAMKMELPLRSSTDATVSAVFCKPGEIVQADAILVQLV